MQHAKNRGDADLIVRGIEAVLRGLNELGPRKQIACPALDVHCCWVKPKVEACDRTSASAL